MDELQYISSLPRGYTPFLYRPKRILLKFLKEKHILNKSNYTPSPTEVEVLALDYGFIPNQNPAHSAVQNSITSYLEKMDRLNYFNHEDQATNNRRGYVSHLFNRPWIAPKTDWKSLPIINAALENLETALELQNEADFPSPLQNAWKSLSENQQIYVMKADKGGATVLWDRKEYCREAHRQLSNHDTYELIDQNNVDVVLSDLQVLKVKMANYLCHHNHITRREMSLITDAQSKIPAIYFLPKIHKTINAESGTFPGRPIVATFECHLHWLDKYLTEITNELHSEIPHSLIDTMDLLHKLQHFDTPLPNNFRLLSADVTNLYPSIRWTPGIAASTEIYSNLYPRLTSQAILRNRLMPPPPPLFAAILQAILENSYMHFLEKEIYHQKRGTAMGMCISVFFAKCYMSKLIQPVMNNPPLHLRMLKVFIDDCIIASTGKDSEILDLITSISNEDIQYTYQPPQATTNMLDLTVFICDGKICTKPFCKPTSKPFYLHAKSMHPRTMIQSIPGSQLLRLRRNSTNTKDFIPPARTLLKTLATRGYDKKMLSSAYEKVLLTPQLDLLNRGDSVNSTSARFRESIKLIIPFNTNFHCGNIRKALTRVHEAISNHFLNLNNGAEDRNPLNKISSEIVFSNSQTLSTRFTSKYKGAN